MTYPIVDLTFWNPGDPGAPEIDALLADPSTPLAKHGLTGIASAYAEETGAFLHEVHRWWANEMTMKSLSVDGALTEVVPALDALGIRYFVAKGPLTATAEYPDRGMRPYTDLDVYVDPIHADAARVGLLALGYERVPHLRGPLGGAGNERHGGSFGAVVEVHERASDNLHGHFLPGLSRYLPLACDTELFGVSVPALPKTASLALELIHAAAGHRYARLILLRDVEARLDVIPASEVEEFGAASYHRVACGLIAALRHRDCAGRSRLGSRLAAGDPRSWNEHDATVRNLLSLVAQPTVPHSLAATLGVARAAVPRYGLRAPLRWQRGSHNAATRSHA